MYIIAVSALRAYHFYTGKVAGIPIPVFLDFGVKGLFSKHTEWKIYKTL